ncbi:DUF4157 domain-containing protein [Streptomyces sp. NPDC013171]|uniref:eCIS core domain-containing protein n=1 Tax=Streptomyces sp. NPDC013171 TaxID=3364863 RepID=UPI00369194CE
MEEEAAVHDRDNTRATGPHSSPARVDRPTPDTALQRLLALHGTAGNAAVVQLLRQAGHAPAGQEQHRHGAGCGHGQPAQVQRSAVHDVLRSGGQPLDAATRTDMEARLGADFSDIRIHTDSAAKASAAEVGARAYTSGSHVVIGEGGADRHTLAHELTHVIQQRQGPVAGTDNGSGLKVSDPSDRFEREAEANATRAMSGAAPVQRTAREPATGSGTGHDTQEPQIQRKSVFTSVSPREQDAQSPIKTLSKAFKPYFTAAGLQEEYEFPGLNLKKPGDYPDTYARAGSVTAEIDPASARKADGSNRNNNVISPYGHFGVMERGLFDRPSRAQAYDGGHLIEHTLMEGQDADVHGNLAPQESKHFNQGLMRGWESFPEHLMHGGHPFTYKVDVDYSDHTYVRTGQQIVDAGVITKLHFNAMPQANQVALAAERVTFRRWVPTQWKGKVEGMPDAQTGLPQNLPLTTLTNGAHLRNLAPTHADAQGMVMDPTNTPGAPHTTVPGRPNALVRQYSGTLGGHIETAALVPNNPGLITVGGQPSVTAHMYQPEPQDLRDQQQATTQPSGQPAPTPLAAAIPTQVAILKRDLSITDLTNSLAGLSTTKVNRGRGSGGPVRVKNPATIDAEAKKQSPEYAHLRKTSYLPSQAAGVLFTKAVIAAVESNAGRPLNRTQLQTVIAGSRINKSEGRDLALFTFDQRTKD